MSTQSYNRRDFMKLAGLGGVVFASSLSGCAGLAGQSEDFHFVQLSDVHLGYDNPKVNPDARNTLQKAIGHQRARPAAGFRHLHGRPHANHGRPAVEGARACGSSATLQAA